MKLVNSSVTLALGLAFSSIAIAQNDMSGANANLTKDSIEAEYKKDKANCESLSGNPKDICMAEAKGKEKVAKAELEARQRNTPKNRYDVETARAEAAYEVAKEKCDERTGNDKDICVKEAKAAKTRAKADAEAKMKVSKAENKAKTTDAEANRKAQEKRSEATQEASAEKREANYKLDKEKCDDLAGDAKQNCVDEAKRRHGQD